MTVTEATSIASLATATSAARTCNMIAMAIISAFTSSVSSINSAARGITLLTAVPSGTITSALIDVYNEAGERFTGTANDLNYVTLQGDCTLYTWNGGRDRGTLDGISETGLHFTGPLGRYSVEIERVKEIIFH